MGIILPFQWRVPIHLNQIMLHAAKKLGCNTNIGSYLFFREPANKGWVTFAKSCENGLRRLGSNYLSAVVDKQLTSFGNDAEKAFKLWQFYI